MLINLRNNYKLDKEVSTREKRIISKINLEKLPFNVSIDTFCSRYTEMFLDLEPLFKYQEGDYAMKWCFSTEKKMRVFLLIFQANELGKEIYKESISNSLPQYSYKTIAKIIDDGIEKKYFLNLAPRFTESKDSKIRNIRPSEDLVIEFVNWTIEVISTFSTFQKKYK
tara:strand:+ start:243 stop:746 length:504 start_codon:yes stop_codon:yes gene_type:complete